MIGIDIIGTENVLKYIEVSKLSKFTIDANKSGHFICIFECINSNSNEIALNEFEKWSSFINPNQTYRITLFDVVDITEDNGILKTKKTKNKSNKMQCSFILNENYSAKNTQQIVGNIDEDAIYKRMQSKLIEEQNSNTILNEIRNLSERLNKMELEEVEEEEEEQTSGLGALGSNQLEQIMGLVNMFKGATQSPQINGDIDTQTEFKANINKAIKILYKNDPLLDKDLLKLANLSETKKETFNMLLSTLRSM
jgi:hypothetical protein